MMAIRKLQRSRGQSGWTDLENPRIRPKTEEELADILLQLIQITRIQDASSAFERLSAVLTVAVPVGCRFMNRDEGSRGY
jgi:NTP pyrophosphatase (non-canonical NTP hydrolase)